MEIVKFLEMSTNLKLNKNWKKWAKNTFFVYFFINLHLIMYTLSLRKLNLAILKGQEPAVSQILESFDSLKRYATFFLVGGSIKYYKMV